MLGMLTEEAFRVQVPSSHFRPPPGQRAIVRLIAQVLSFYLCCRHVLEEEEARAPSPKDGRAGGGTKPAAARIGEAGMSAFLVNHSVPTQKAVDLVQRIYGPPGLSSSDQVSTTRHVRAQRRPVGAALQLQQRADAPKSADATRRPNGVRQSTAMLSVASGEGRDRRAEPHDGRRPRHDRGAQAAAVPRRVTSLRASRPIKSCTPATQNTNALTRTRCTGARTHAHALAACCAAIDDTTTHEGAAGVALSRCHCALMDAIRSAAGAGAAGSVLRRSRRRRRRTDQPRRVHRSRQEGAALLAARQGRSHSPSPFPSTPSARAPLPFPCPPRAACSPQRRAATAVRSAQPRAG